MSARLAAIGLGVDQLERAVPGRVVATAPIITSRVAVVTAAIPGSPGRTLRGRSAAEAEQ